MDAIDKLRILNDDVGMEVAEEIRTSVPAAACPASGAVEAVWAQGLPVTMAALPNGKRTPILKGMVTSACERNCNYCAFRAGRDFRRVTFKPEEMASAVDTLTRRGVIEGAFISSGVAGGGVHTQDRLIAAAEVLRKKLHYRGYLHLKLMPGCEKDQVERAMQLADRVSVNLEGPNSRTLALLAPQKVFLEELLQPLKWVEEIRREKPGWQGWNGRWPSSVTQFVVGAVGESDLDLLAIVQALHRNVRLARGYFSRFTPTAGTPFEHLPATDPWREHRLYQASFLLRDYGFDVEEIPFSGAGNLPLDMDPKLAWARSHLEGRPLEINRGSREELLRIPGVGPKSAAAILSARRENRLRSLEDLKALGIAAGRAAPFILLDGRRPAVQLSLWS